jgi:hypothetical protein
MDWASELSCYIPFTSGSNLSDGFHVFAAIGGGAPHLFEIDTGSVGILVPRASLGPEYQTFDPSKDIEFQLVSSGDVYWGQWVIVPAILGVPAGWDGGGDYPSAEIEVFAVDRPAEFDGGLLGIGFAIGGLADGGPARNPLLHLTYQGERLHSGYVLNAQGIDAGLNSVNTAGFAFVQLQRNQSGDDWMQPVGTLGLPNGFSIDLPVLVDTGIDEMLLWLETSQRPPELAAYSVFPTGVQVAIAVPPSSPTPALRYSFVTGDPSEPMAPSAVEWREGRGINTGRDLLVGIDYLYDAASGNVGFRMPFLTAPRTE